MYDVVFKRSPKGKRVGTPTALPGTSPKSDNSASFVDKQNTDVGFGGGREGG